MLILVFLSNLQVWGFSVKAFLPVAAILFSLSTVGLAKDAAQEGDERRICKRDDMVTGTRTARTKICRTKAEWDFLKSDAEKGVRQTLESVKKAEEAVRNAPR
jgi:hypothetical protein